ncbi:hypothetical protein, partial [Streptomyces sp. NPDC006307]|uniref:TolB family protein n=1 Tax=Streptomyces sp. NPDC006307 TaxID=3156748 RepID=UPI0033BBFF90
MAADARHRLSRRPAIDTAAPGPVPVALAGAAGPLDTPQPVVSHGCWYPSADPTGERVAFICDRGGVPQLWTGPAAAALGGAGAAEVHLLDADPEPVTEVAWSPDGRWIAYTVNPGGGEHSRVLCVRPDGSDRRVVAGADAGSSAYLGCWARDGSAVAVTVAEPPSAYRDPEPGLAGLPAGWAERDGHATLLGGAGRGAVGHRRGTRDRLSAYLVDPDEPGAATLLATETGAATLRVCDLSQDGRLALLRRGPRARREAVVLRTEDLGTGCVLRVADADPWIGRFSADGRTVWLRSDHEREFAALLAAGLDERGELKDVSVVAERERSDLELLAFLGDGRTAALAWNVRGATELELLDVESGVGGALPIRPDQGAVSGAWGLPRPPGAEGTDRKAEEGATAGHWRPTTTLGAPPVPAGLREGGAVPDAASPARSARHPPSARRVELPHEVVTRVARGGPAGMVLAVSGSQRRPGVWWAADGGAPARTPWSSRDEDAVPAGRPPVRPVPVRLTSRDGLELGGWYYRAPGRADTDPAARSARPPPAAPGAPPSPSS